MVEALGTALRSLSLAVGFLAITSNTFAHRLDEYLQATLVMIEPSVIRLKINLTPGVAIADKVLSIIDRGRDGVISTNEAQVYGDLLKRSLAVRLDSRKLDLKLTD